MALGPQQAKIVEDDTASPSSATQNTLNTSALSNSGASFPHALDHGSGLFNHPSVDRATASLMESKLGSSPATTQSNAHSVELSKYKAQAGKDFGNRKAYNRNRREAAKAGVKLAAYSSLRAHKTAPPAQGE